LDQEPRRSKSAGIEPNFGPNFVIAFLEEIELLDEQTINVYLIMEYPKTYNKVIESINLHFWKKAIDSELESLMVNRTWTLTDLPSGCKTVKSK